MDNPETVSGAPTIGHNESAPPPSPSQPASQVEIDDSKATACYANFCRLSGTPEELLIDFGLNPQPVGIPSQPIVLSQRLVAGWYTAKRLLQVLQLTIERHEAVFGVLETDVQKRVRRA
jgi:hypothetical protein